MAIQDEEFTRRLRATFQVEAEEHLQAMSSMLLKLEKSSPSQYDAATIEAIYREAHTLKGAARAVDLPAIEAICQTLEGVFSVYKREQTIPSSKTFDIFHRVLDMIGVLLTSTGTILGDAQNQLDELITCLNKVQMVAPSADRNAIASTEIPRQQPLPGKTTPIQSVELEKAAVAETVRISVPKLDARLLQAEDMLSVKAMLAQRAAELGEISGLFEQWRKEWAKIAPEVRSSRQSFEHANKANVRDYSVSPSVISFLEWNRDYMRGLESKLSALTMQAAQDRHTVGKRVDDLLEDSKKLLMLPFSTLDGLLPKIVRDLCRDQEKEADLAIQGGQVEIDKRILEEMKDALIHILRNCVDHGVEKPDERVRLNKPARASISVNVSPVDGNKVEILVSDDGAGVNLDRVKASAIQHGILSQADALTLNDAQATALIFRSEVSTSPIVTAISGRGLGMAIVRSKAEKLGGRVFIESKRHVGTTLRILLPLTLATFRGILVAVADRVFVLPTANVERVTRVQPQDIHTVENREIISMQEKPLALARLEAVLALPLKSTNVTPSGSIPIVILQSADERIAFAVDSILHEEEVLVKSFRKPLIRVRNIAGATVLGSGKAVPILNVGDLMKSARVHGAVPERVAPVEQPRKAPAKKVLVVEDSVTSRMLLKGILESAGYQVKTAVDGVDAYAVLREDTFNLVVSDVEMPRMNGFDLTVKIRGDKRLSELPIVLVTALELREEREHGIDAGASAYIVKSTFDQSNLLEVVRRLL